MAQADADIWNRLRSGFQIPVPVAQPKLQSEIRQIKQNPHYLKRLSNQASPYLHYVLTEVEANHLPSEIALLPMVESSYLPFAYSHGQAAGLWQFIPSTAKHFGLEQNWWYDGRRDVHASTKAAVTYLKSLHRSFEGDWLLALAAYNSGQGTVHRAMSRNRRKGLGVDFWSLSLPRETASYVPKLIAVAEVIANPSRYQIDLATIKDQPALVKIDVDAQIDMAIAADLADLTIDELYRLNPGFNRWATAPDGPHYLMIPAESAQNFKNKLAQLPAEKRLKWIRYTVKKNETLGHLAIRYGTSAKHIREANELKNNEIRIGQKLIIPLASKQLERYELTMSQRKLAIKNRGNGKNRLSYRVRSGDSLWLIARKFGVSVHQLAKWNGMAPKDTLQINDTLVIYPNQNGKIATAKSLQSIGPAESRSVQRVYYKVRRGDSLYLIAKRFQVHVTKLKEWNQLHNKKYLQPGQILKLYVDVTEVSDRS